MAGLRALISVLVVAFGAAMRFSDIGRYDAACDMTISSKDHDWHEMVNCAQWWRNPKIVVKL